jgi:hypothetical protein
MERMGGRIDKARIKAALEAMIQRQSAHMGRQKRRPRNEALERLKFWLGIPNSYYESDWRSSERGDDRESDNDSASDTNAETW